MVHRELHQDYKCFQNILNRKIHQLNQQLRQPLFNYFFSSITLIISQETVVIASLNFY